jgi:hypothetical protein
MRRQLIFIAFSILVVIASIFQVNAQFVTLDGRQFKDGNGQDWYPMVMDYFLSINYDGSNIVNLYPCESYEMPTNFWPAPNSHYGPTIGPEEENALDCQIALKKDFAAIKGMGFNCIRLTTGLHWHNDDLQFKLWTNCGRMNCYCAPYFLPISIHNSNTSPQDQLVMTNVNLYFDMLENLIEWSSEYQLKVMIDVVLFTESQNCDCLFNDNMRPALLLYLHELGDRFKNNTNLFAYCILEEIGLNDHNNNRTKQEACEIVSSLYDELKAADNNHLISISGNDIDELEDWDLGSMKLDFYQPHMYPLISNENPATLDYHAGLNRMLGRMYWLSKHSPIPWIIGETGFQANDIHCNQQLEPNYFSKMDGTELEQSIFTEQSINQTYNCGGSGYSWFMYQDGWVYDEASQGLPNCCIYPDGHGLIRQGVIPATPPPPPPSSLPSSWSEISKPVLNVFRNYMNPGSINNSCNCIIPNDYYDPYKFISNNTPNHRIEGTISETNNPDNKIEGALIRGTSVWTPDNGITTIRRQIYTFTDINGHYQIYSCPPGTEPLSFESMIITYPGSDAYFHTKIEDFPQIIDKSLRQPKQLKDLTLDLNSIQGSNQIFQSWNSILINNVILDQGYSGEFTTRSEIDIKHESDFKHGAEIHAYCSTTMPDCDLLNKQTLIKKEIPTSNYSTSGKSIEVHFQMDINKSKLVLQPNPTNGWLELSCDNLNKNDKLSVCVIDLSGSTVFTQSGIFEKGQIDVSSLKPGYYILRIISEDFIKNLPFIKY